METIPLAALGASLLTLLATFFLLHLRNKDNARLQEILREQFAQQQNLGAPTVTWSFGLELNRPEEK